MTALAAVPAALTRDGRMTAKLSGKCRYVRVGHAYVPKPNDPILPLQERSPVYFDRRQKCRRRNHQFAEPRIRDEASSRALNIDFAPFSILPIYDKGKYRKGFEMTLPGSTIPVDANGFAEITPIEPSGYGSGHTDTGSRLLCVSQAGNDSTGTGTVEAPLKTIAKAVSFVRRGFPDQILLNKDDVWTNERFGHLSVGSANATGYGRSANEPLVFGTYGEGARPELKLRWDQSIFSLRGTSENQDGSGDFILVSGIDARAYERDPDDPDFNSELTSAAGSFFSTLRAFDWICFDNCRFSFGAGAISAEPFFQESTIPPADYDMILILNHCIAHHIYKENGAHASAVYVAGAKECHIIGGIVDLGGWHPDYPGSRTTQNHNFYMQGANSGGTPTNVDFNNCYFDEVISSRASQNGVQGRWGSGATNCLFMGNPIAGFFGTTENEEAPYWIDCVILHGVSAFGTIHSWGINIRSTQPTYPIVAGAKFQRCIVAHSLYSNPANAYQVEGTSPDAIVDNCILFKWNASNPLSVSAESNLAVNDLLVDQGDSNIHGFPEPTRTILTYCNDVLEQDFSTIDEAMDWFCTQCYTKLTKEDFDELYTADAVNTYIREGFGLAASEPAAPTVTTGAVENLDHESVTLNGSVTDVGGSPMVRRGYVWGASENPVVDVDNTIEKGGSLGPITPHHLEGLTAETSLHYRAFAENGVDISYGADVPFTTTAAPTIHVQVMNSGASNIRKTKAIVTGNVTDAAGHTITERAFVWNLTGAPTTSDNKVAAEGTGEGEFSVELTGLTGGQPIFYRPAVTSSDGGGHTDYGEQMSLTTYTEIKKKLTKALA